VVKLIAAGTATFLPFDSCSGSAYAQLNLIRLVTTFDIIRTMRKWILSLHQIVLPVYSRVWCTAYAFYLCTLMLTNFNITISVDCFSELDGVVPFSPLSRLPSHFFPFPFSLYLSLNLPNQPKAPQERCKLPRRNLKQNSGRHAQNFEYFNPGKSRLMAAVIFRCHDLRKMSKVSLSMIVASIAGRC